MGCWGAFQRIHCQTAEWILARRLLQYGLAVLPRRLLGRDFVRLDTLLAIEA